jgi:competence protein ComEA
MNIAEVHITPRLAIMAAVTVILVAALITTITTPAQAVELGDAPAVSLDLSPTPTPGTIRVEISGGVSQPGVITLPEASRLIDAISAAGGWGERIDPLRVELCLNLAAPIEDGSAVRIPTRDDRLLLGLTGVECGPLYSSAAEVASAGLSGGSGSGTATGGKIDLNHASAEELDTLPGIGPVTAAKIIAARKEKPFLIVDDLRDRKIISEGVLQEIRALVIP